MPECGSKNIKSSDSTMEYGGDGDRGIGGMLCRSHDEATSKLLGYSVSSVFQTYS